jgi:S1-C subfamily serine protease
MGSMLRTAFIATLSSLLTLGLVVGCGGALPLVSSRPTPSTAQPAATAGTAASTASPAASVVGQGSPSTAAPDISIRPSVPVAQAQAGPAGSSYDAIIRVYKDASPAVVNVISTVVTRDFFNQAAPRPIGTGSGFVVDDQGTIVTNNHVVEDADRLEVTLADGATVPAKCCAGRRQ